MADVRLIDANVLGRCLSDWQMSLPEDNRPDWDAAAYDTLDNVLDAINKAPTIDPESLRPQWISVKDRLPGDKWDMAVVFTDGADIFFAWYNNNEDGRTFGWTDENDDPIEGVTHWMPLPEPPEEEHHDQPHL